jgi:tRNA-dihydrouridine synthase C
MPGPLGCVAGATIAAFAALAAMFSGVWVRLLLAPMEGLLDDVLRAALTRVGGYDHAVSEFARVSGTVLPERFFRRIVPELDHGGRTAAGTPVHVQMLGSDPACMAVNAARLARLNPPGVDLNFGCPAPTVNRHRGGAVLLDEPELLWRITQAVGGALPAGLALSAKMRLGVNDPARAVECAQALVDGGAQLLVVHARTKADGYRPPAHWEWVARIAEAVPVPVVANGEVWSAQDWVRCREVSGVADVMLGRGAVADPFLAQRIRAGRLHEPDAAEREREWQALQPLIGAFVCGVQRKVEARHAPGRLKQWVHMLARKHARARALFACIRPLRTLPEVVAELGRHGILCDAPAIACAQT